MDTPVTVSAAEGVLGAVSLTDEDGDPLAGQLGPDGLIWATTAPLGYNKRYTMQAEALGLVGVARSTMTFQTRSPENLTMPYVLPNAGEVVGIGQSVAIRFDETFLTAPQPRRRSASPPIRLPKERSTGSAIREIRWRPEAFWQPGTTFDVAVNPYGVDLGDGLSGQDDVTTRFTIGDEVMATADDITKTLTVRVNGEVVKTMPVSMGKNSAPTDNGTYLVGDRYRDLGTDGLGDWNIPWEQWQAGNAAT